MGFNYYDPKEPLPCDSCENRRCCTIHEMSCEVYNLYTGSGRISVKRADSYHPNKQLLKAHQKEYKQRGGNKVWNKKAKIIATG